MRINSIETRSLTSIVVVLLDTKDACMMRNPRRLSAKATLRTAPNKNEPMLLAKHKLLASSKKKLSSILVQERNFDK